MQNDPLRSKKSSGYSPFVEEIIANLRADVDSEDKTEVGEYFFVADPHQDVDLDLNWFRQKGIKIKPIKAKKKLPPSFCDYLLVTLPKELADEYIGDLTMDYRKWLTRRGKRYADTMSILRVSSIMLRRIPFSLWKFIVNNVTKYTIK